jgi:hypothetical protein
MSNITKARSNEGGISKKSRYARREIAMKIKVSMLRLLYGKNLFCKNL